MGTITTVYEPMSQEEIDRINRRRWRRHRIDSLPPGVSLVEEGKNASFYVRIGDTIVELEAELASGPSIDVSINIEGLAWQIDVHTLGRHPASADHATRSKCELEAWLAQKNWRFAYYP